MPIEKIINLKSLILFVFFMTIIFQLNSQIEENVKTKSHSLFLAENECSVKDSLNCSSQYDTLNEQDAFELQNKRALFGDNIRDLFGSSNSKSIQ